jgi:spermidine synthase
MSWIEVSQARTPEGGAMVLRCRDGVYEIRVNGWELMSNRAHRSEEAMAELACAGRGDGSNILIGGLGMGYTLRAALEHLPGDARVTVAELMPEIVDWNRGPLAPLAGRPLSDPRVALCQGDVGEVIAAADGTYDVILLDVDNGPQALSDRGNHRLYRPAGLAAARRALRPGGMLAVWSADPVPAFERALAAAGFRASSVEVSPRGTPDGPMHTILFGIRPEIARKP